MAAEIVQIDYALVDTIVKRFQKLHDQSQAIQNNLTQTIAPLQAGQWQGAAATACFQEFEHVVTPAFNRLLHTLQSAVETTQAIRKTLADAEAEAEALFRGEFGAIALGGNGAMFAQEGGTRGVDFNAIPTPDPPADTSLLPPFLQKLIDFILQTVETWQNDRADGVQVNEDGSVSYADATLLFDDMADEADIPFRYPDDGCYARAHLMTYRIHERYGIPLESLDKAYIRGSETAPDTHLTVDTDYVYPGQSSADGTVDWGWHIAPTVDVKNADGSIITMVIDPSLANRPLPLADWQALMNDTDSLVETDSYLLYGQNQFGNKLYISEDFPLDVANSTSESILEEYMNRCTEAGYCD